MHDENHPYGNLENALIVFSSIKIEWNRVNPDFISRLPTTASSMIYHLKHFGRYTSTASSTLIMHPSTR